ARPHAIRVARPAGVGRVAGRTLPRRQRERAEPDPVRSPGGGRGRRVGGLRGPAPPRAPAKRRTHQRPARRQRRTLPPRPRRHRGRRRARRSSSMTLRIVAETGPAEAEREAIRDRLDEWNMVVTGRRDWSILTILLRDGAGAIRGGVLGNIWASW